MNPNYLIILLDGFFESIFNIACGIGALAVVVYIIMFISKISGDTLVSKGGKIIATPNDFDQINKKVVDTVKQTVNKVNGVTNTSIHPHTKRLFDISESGMRLLTDDYKLLPNNGRFEVLLFNRMILMKEYSELFPNNYRRVLAEYTNLCKVIAMETKIPFAPTSLDQFMDSRMEFYVKEFVSIFSNKNYIGICLYNNFYTHPLSIHPYSGSETLFEYLEFLPVYTSMVKHIIEKIRAMKV